MFSTVGCCVYIRHRQVLRWQEERSHDLVDRRLVVATAYCGILACFGLDILANFQEARVVAAHMVGAMTCFSAGTLYFCLQVHRNADLYVLSCILLVGRHSFTDNVAATRWRYRTNVYPQSDVERGLFLFFELSTLNIRRPL